MTFKQTGIDRLIIANRNNANPYYPIGWDEPSFTLGSDFTMPSGGMSAYHESSLKLGDFTITAGLRFDWERTSLDFRSFCKTTPTRPSPLFLSSTNPLSTSMRVTTSRTITPSCYRKSPCLTGFPATTATYTPL